ncbi:Basement membrane-specific heparan sulfate proteoglycan core protein [Geodia barretti]|uniref:Basement membrane-specific heparan sulfate proteoglycan core protein n=1 Tax=Geodia barretti TaxID=519541 RepID=A0AA35S7B8_GEOBA|nr:Basement membrane-specific heparan sulfate proteoglycan core protein [Geodia barretti]
MVECIHPPCASLRTDLKPPVVGVGAEGVPTAGGDYSLVCTLETEEGVGSEDISIIWTTPSGEMKMAEDVSNSGTIGKLNFSPLNTSDRGDYICTGRVLVDSVMVNVSANSVWILMSLVIPAPRVSVGTNAGDEGPYYRGTQLDIICSISVDASVNTLFYVNITWTRDSKSVMSDPNITISRANTSRLEFTSTLAISPLDTSDSAFYTCTASVFPTDGEGVLASNGATASVNVSVEEPLAPNVTRAKIVSKAGKPFSTECNFTAPLNLVTPPSVEWLNSSGDLVSSNKTLSFPLLKTSDGGAYTCRVNFSIPSLGISESGNGTTRLIVQIPAPTITALNDYTPYNGTKFNMTCTVEVECGCGYSHHYSQPLRGEDNGTYTCRGRVQPTRGDKYIMEVSANETTDVIVQGLPKPTVRITLSSSAGSGTQECLGVDFGGQQANNISCLAGVTNSLLNPHTVTLMGDGGRINTSKSGQNITKDLQLSSGPRTFTCSVCINIAEARISNYCSSEDVNVSGNVPGEIRPNFIVNTPDAVTISWVDSAEIFSILRYIVLVERYIEAGPGRERTEKVEGYPQELPGTLQHHTVKSLEKETPYVYTLVAGNTEGCGPQSRSIFFTEEGVPKVPPHNVKVERINGTAMMVSFGRLSLVEARRVSIYYFVSYSPSGGTRKRQGGGREGPVEGNTTVVTGLNPSTGYDVSVFTATDEQGNRQLTSSEEMTAPRLQTSEPSGSGNAGAIIGGIVVALLVAIIVVAVILVVLWIKRFLNYPLTTSLLHQFVCCYRCYWL